MSIDYYVFTKSGQRVTRDQLVAALMNYAINSEIYCDIDTSKTIEGEITEYRTVLCWPNESISRAELIEVLQQQNCVERDKLFEDGLLGYCNISASAAQDFFENQSARSFEDSNSLFAIPFLSTGSYSLIFCHTELGRSVMRSRTSCVS